MRTKGKPSNELGHTSQATYFIARDRKIWSLSCTRVKMGKKFINLTSLNQHYVMGGNQLWVNWMNGEK